MTQRSYFWDGTVTGDAGPFTPNDHNHFVWSRLFGLYRNPIDSGNILVGATQGIIEGVGNELIVQGTVGGIVIGTGAAIVDGTLYQNTSALTLPVTTPASQTVYSVILRKNFGTQEIRATFRTLGDLTAQLDTIWDLVIAKFSIDTDGTIIVADNRRFARSPLIPAAGMQLIETQTLIAESALVVFSDIPQTYRHLQLESEITFATTLTTEILLQINKNTTGVYNFEHLTGRSVTSEASALADQEWIFDAISAGTSNEIIYRALFSNYRKPTVKTIIGSRSLQDNVNQFGAIVDDVNPIISIELTTKQLTAGGSAAESYGIGSTFSLYGII